MDSPPRTYSCALCGYSRDKKACTTPPGKSPDFCPMVVSPEVFARAAAHYDDPETAAFARAASLQEADGYVDRHPDSPGPRAVRPRIEEVWLFARRIGVQRVGLAFCLGLAHEARLTAEILAAHELEVVSVCCKAGAVPKERLGLGDADKLRPGKHESMCNPIAQAELFNEAQTGLNVLLGLCVGHDALLMQHSRAPCTVLAVKDRVTGHNPLAAVYTAHSYYRRLDDE